MSTGHDNEGFLSRWSKRKQSASQGTLPEPEREDTSAAQLPEPEPLSEEAELQRLREEDPELAETISRIDVDALSYDDDYSVFMKDKVPEFIRRKALAKLWQSNPLLANVDGLCEYDEDFTDAATVMENFQSAWQPGRGYKKPEDEEPDLADPEDDEEAEAVVADADLDDADQELAEDGDRTEPEAPDPPEKTV